MSTFQDKSIGYGEFGANLGYQEQHWVVARSVLDPTACMAGI